MKRKHVISGAGVVVLAATILTFMAWPVDFLPTPVAETEAVDPLQGGSAPDSGAASPVDRSARWGFVLYDDVRTTSEPVIVLNTGDQVYLGETDDQHKDQTKITLFDGRSGWVSTAKVFEATTFAPWNVLDSSTAPLKDWIPEDLVTPANIAQYKVLVSGDFLMRASKNPNPTIADWAQAVLSRQAESAGQ